MVNKLEVFCLRSRNKKRKEGNLNNRNPTVLS